MMASVVVSKFFCVAKHFILRQVIRAFTSFPQKLTQLLAHVTKVVVLSVVHIQSVCVVKVLFFAEETARMLLLNVSV